MKIYFTLLFIFLWSVSMIAGCSEKNKEVTTITGLENLVVSPSMKGWELYSWPEGNAWKFSFLTGTNRLKNLSEVTSSNGNANLIIVTGADSAKMVLNRFPVGEDIMLIGKGWLQNAWGAQYGSLQLPPQSVIDDLSAFSNQKKLTFTVAN